MRSPFKTDFILTLLFSLLVSPVVAFFTFLVWN